MQHNENMKQPLYNHEVQPKQQVLHRHRYNYELEFIQPKI